VTDPASCTARVCVREFHSRALRNGDARTIAILSRADDNPALAITVFRDGRPLTRVLWTRRELRPLETAFDLLSDPRFDGVARAGATRHGAGLSLVVEARACGADRGVAFWREANGQVVGRAVPIYGAELDALRQAVAELQRLAKC
jgi:hypothetical protein